MYAFKTKKWRKNTPDSVFSENSDDLKYGAISSLSSRRRGLSLSLSGPAALPGLRFLRHFRIPALQQLRCQIPP